MSKHAEDPAPTPADPRPDTVVLAAFEGWNDAGSAASHALEHLADQWDAEPVDDLDPEEYHDFQVNRPVVTTALDGTRELAWPTTHIALAHTPVLDRSVVLVHGIEPSFRWRRYCAEILDVAAELGARTLITLGALLADVPHTRPIPVTTSSDSPHVRDRLLIEASTYEGPTGIVGVLQHEAAQRGIEVISLWAAVPHYVAHPPSPKATLALLDRLEGLLGESIELGDLPEEALAWQRGVDKVSEDDAEVAEYVTQLEEAKDTADLPEASGEAIAQEFERYLRRRDKGDPGRGDPGGRGPS